MITLSDGSVVFKANEVVPKELIYHSRDPQNSRRFIPSFIPCKYREIQKSTKPCGALAVCWFCQAKKQTVTVPICDECEIEPKT